MYERRGLISGLSTGFRELDYLIDGMHEGDVTVIAGRPGMGKTALALNIAEHVALDLGKPIALFSLDLSSRLLIERLICAHARISLKKIKDGLLSDRDFLKLKEASSKFANSQLIINDTAHLSLTDLSEKAHEYKVQHGIKIIIIDGLRLLQSNSNRVQKTQREKVSMGIKALAKDLNVPIIVIADLKRNLEKWSSGVRRPRLSDIRKSGSIEIYADIVGFLVREEYYADSEEEKQELEGKSTLIIAKQRNNPIGDVYLNFVKELVRFEDQVRQIPLA